MAGLDITEQTILVTGIPVQPAAFPGLIQRHPQGVEIALCLEAEAEQLLASNLPRHQIKAFIRNVCRWGGYPKTAAQVLRRNSLSEIRVRFSEAITALNLENPRPALALRELGQLRGLGISFGSKHLRFLRPEICPVLDSILSEKLGYPLQVHTYRHFSADCLRVAELLERQHVVNPFARKAGAWFAADIEMALYVYIKEKLR